MLLMTMMVMMKMMMMMMMLMMMMMTSSGSFILGLLPSRLVIAVMIVLCFRRAFDAALIGRAELQNVIFFTQSNSEG